MMKGSNKIQLNQATMRDAVQMYINSEFREGEAPVVGKVESVKGQHEDSFDIVLDEEGLLKDDDGDG